MSAKKQEELLGGGLLFKNVKKVVAVIALSTMFATMFSFGNFFKDGAALPRIDTVHADANCTVVVTTKNPCPKKKWQYKYNLNCFNTKIEDIRDKAIIKLIGKCLGSVAKPLGKAYEQAAEWIRKDVNKNKPKCKSYKTKVYYPKGGRVFTKKGNTLSVRKMVMTFYQKKNYSGKSKKFTYYEVKTYH